MHENKHPYIILVFILNIKSYRHMIINSLTTHDGLLAKIFIGSMIKVSITIDPHSSNMK